MFETQECERINFFRNTLWLHLNQLSQQCVTSDDVSQRHPCRILCIVDSLEWKEPQTFISLPSSREAQIGTVSCQGHTVNMPPGKYLTCLTLGSFSTVTFSLKHSEVGRKSREGRPRCSLIYGKQGCHNMNVNPRFCSSLEGGVIPS